ncbi:zinc finger, CCHC-type containing protein [Tanacetum coccineum]
MPCDSALAGCDIFLLGGGAISWASKKQTCIASSTMESEFVALAAAGKEAEWLRNLLLEILLWSKPIAPISIRRDSDATWQRLIARCIYISSEGCAWNLLKRRMKSLLLNGSMEFSSYNIYELDMDTWLV